MRRRLLQSLTAINANGLPAGYKRVEYLESTGTQYIDTLVKVQANLTIRLRFKDLDYAGQSLAAYYLFGGFGNKQAFGFGFFQPTRPLYGDEIAWACAGDYNGPVYLDTGLSRNEFIKAEHVVTIKNMNIDLKGTSYIPKDSNSKYEGDSTIGLFAIINQGAVRSYKPRCQIFEFEITHEKVICKLVPCLDPTGAPCMYDLVSKQAFYSSSEDDFLYPGKETEATTFSLRRPVMYAQLTPNGVRRLYKVPDGCSMTKDEYAAANGFKELVESPMPYEGYWRPEWRETETQLILEWIETEAPEEEFNFIPEIKDIEE